MIGCNVITDSIMGGGGGGYSYYLGASQISPLYPASTEYPPRIQPQYRVKPSRADCEAD